MLPTSYRKLIYEVSLGVELDFIQFGPLREGEILRGISFNLTAVTALAEDAALLGINVGLFSNKLQTLNVAAFETGNLLVSHGTTPDNEVFTLIPLFVSGATPAAVGIWQYYLPLNLAVGPEFQWAVLKLDALPTAADSITGFVVFDVVPASCKCSS